VFLRVDIDPVAAQSRNAIFRATCISAGKESSMAASVQWDHIWLNLQWHAGMMGMKSGWDKKDVVQIDELGKQGYELCGVINQKDPTWFILFFKRQVQ
jgi:hypothetical protein